MMGKMLKAEEWLRKGRTAAFRNAINFEDPDHIYIDEEAEIGDGAVIEPNVFISGRTIIGRNCRIGPQVVITDCVIGEGVFIGPGAVLKRCTVGDRVKIPHVCYLGDALIEEETNIGAGTITSNFDGFEKHKTLLGPRCFIGTFVDFIAPVTVGAESFIASRTRLSTKAEIPPHSFVFEEVRNRRPHIVCKANCAFKLPGHWKWLWTREPIDPPKMRIFFDLIVELVPDYPTWLKTPQPELQGDRPKDVIKKRGEEGLEKILNLIAQQSLSILNI